jgi:hypothetical protein
MLSFTSPWRGEVAGQSPAGGGDVLIWLADFTPPRRSAPTLPIQGRVKMSSG